MVMPRLYHKSSLPDQSFHDLLGISGLPPQRRVPEFLWRKLSVCVEEVLHKATEGRLRGRAAPCRVSGELGLQTEPPPGQSICAAVRIRAQQSAAEP